MPKVIVNGRAIEHYKDFDVREIGLYNVQGDPIYKDAVSNGYPPDDIITNGLALYLPLYALKGSSFKSVDRYQHSCTVTTALWQPNGRHFDGDDWIDCGNADSLKLQTLTWEVWVKAQGMTANTTYKGVFSKGNNFHNGISLYYSNDVPVKIHLAVDNLDDTYTKLDYSSPGITTFHHVVGLVTPTDIELIVDNVSKGTNSGNYAATMDAANVTVGSVAAGVRASACYIGEVRLYNHILTTGEIAHNRNVTEWRYQ